MRKLSCTWSLLTALFLSGCGTVPVDLDSVESARFLHEDNRRNLACDIPVPWAIISREDLGGPGVEPRPLAPELPQAGFRTGYVRGADPVPCERQTYQRTDAVFQFDFRSFLSRFRPDQIRVALLSVEEVQTERDVLIVYAEPWRDTELSGSTPGDRTSLPFQIKAVRSRWTPMPADAPAATQGRPDTAPLPDVSPGRSRFSVPLSPSATPTYVVTDEVRRFLAASADGTQSFGFALEPTPDYQIQRYKRFNEVRAAFRLRLRLLVAP